MMLTRHTQVENLANLLATRRKHMLDRDRRDEGYRKLVATTLEVPIEAIEHPRPHAGRPPVLSLAARRARAA